MRRFSRRPFRSRLFKRRRKKTEWIAGADFRFFVAQELDPILDSGGLAFSHSAGVLLVGSVADFNDFQSGFMLERCVGHFHAFVSTPGQQENIISPDGAEIRMSIQRQRVYVNNLDPAPSFQHSNLDSADEMGDEEIYWTRRFNQPRLPGEARPAIDFLTGAGGPPLGNGAFADFSDIFVEAQDKQMEVQGLPFLDLRARHRVHVDNRIFLYFDVVKGDGTPFLATDQVFLHLNGYIRLLITPL